MAHVIYYGARLRVSSDWHFGSEMGLDLNQKPDGVDTTTFLAMAWAFQDDLGISGWPGHPRMAWGFQDADDRNVSTG